MEIVFVKKIIKSLLCVEAFISMHYHEYHKNFVFSGEKHNFWEAVYIDKGEIIVSRDSKKKKKITQGQMIFFKPDEFHALRANGINAANIFVISFVCKSKLMNYFEEKIIDLDKQQKNIIGMIISEAVASFNMPPLDPKVMNLEPLANPPFGSIQIIKFQLETLLILLLRSHMEATKIQNTAYETEAFIIDDIIKYLENNINKKILMKDICSHFNYSKTYLCNKFKEYVGCTIWDYFTKLKINEAKKLIREKKLNLYQICSLLQYRSYSHFQKTFKKITNLTPKEYSSILKV